MASPLEPCEGCPAEQCAQAIPAGYYRAGDRHQSDLALHYLEDGHLQVLWEDGRRLAADRKQGSEEFSLSLGVGKTATFVYDRAAATLVKQPRAGKKNAVPYERVGLWPHRLGPEFFRAPRDVDTITGDLWERGVAVVRGVFAEQLPLLHEVHAAFFKPPDDRSNTRGWYSNHRDYDAEIPSMVRELVAPLTPFLDAALGQHMWEYDESLQVAFATSHKVVPRLPNYHIDHMFLNRGEPFSVLIGVPLVGEFDKTLGGALAVFESSHMLIRSMLEARTTEELSSAADKTVKLNSFCGVSTWQPTLVQAMPGDVFFCHSRTIHGVTPNYEKDRSVAYLRIRVKREVLAQRQIKPLQLWIESVLAYDPFALFASGAAAPPPAESERDSPTLSHEQAAS